MPRPGDPERRTQLARPVCQIAIARMVAAAAHGPDSFEWLDRANENGAGEARAPSDRVDAPMHSVDEVHVRAPRRPVKHLGASRAARRGMTGQIFLARVG